MTLVALNILSKKKEILKEIKYFQTSKWNWFYKLLKN